MDTIAVTETLQTNNFTTTFFSTVADNSTNISFTTGMMRRPSQTSGFDREILSYLLTATIAIVMVGMGAGTDLQKLKTHVMRPIGIAIGAICQFIFMPLIAYALAKIAGMTNVQTLGLLIVGSCPGGTASNAVTYWIEGDLDLSVTMTTVSTILSLGMFPLLFFIYGEVIDGTIAVPFEAIGINLASLIPSVIVGMAIKYKFPRVADVLVKVLSGFGLLAIIAVAVVSFVTYASVLILTRAQIACAAVFPGIGMALGYGFSSLVSLYRPWRQRHCQRRTISVETGVQNTQLAASIIQLSRFPLRITGQIILFPVAYLIAQFAWLIVMSIGYRLYLWLYKGETPRLRLLSSKVENMEDDKVAEEKSVESEDYINPAFVNSDPPVYEEIVANKPHNFSAVSCL